MDAGATYEICHTSFFQKEEEKGVPTVQADWLPGSDRADCPACGKPLTYRQIQLLPRFCQYSKEEEEEEEEDNACYVGRCSIEYHVCPACKAGRVNVGFGYCIGHSRRRRIS